MAERSKAHAWNACMREIVSRVRIPLSPPSTSLCYVILCHNTTVSLDSLDEGFPRNRTKYNLPEDYKPTVTHNKLEDIQLYLTLLITTLLCIFAFITSLLYYFLTR